MGKNYLISLLAAHGLLIMEFKEDRFFNAIGALPPWAKKIYALRDLQNVKLKPEVLFPFLEGFMEKVHKMWIAEPDTFQRLKSAWWTEVDKKCDVHYCCATALNFKKNKYLIIEHATDSDEIIKTLQKYKESLLTVEELLEKKSVSQEAPAGLAAEFSLTDHVTGLHNSRAFHMLAEHQVMLAKRKGLTTIIVMIDMVNLDVIDKKYGKTEAITALHGVTDIVKQTYRNSDIIARFGDNGFAVLALEVAEKGEKSILIRFKKNLDKFNMASFKTYDIILAMGIVACSADYAGTVKEMIQMAGYKLNENKRTKKFL